MSAQPLASAASHGAFETEAIPLSQQRKLVGHGLDEHKKLQHVLSTYLSLRQLLAVTAFLFPIVLIGFGFLLAETPVKSSFSAYYHENETRDFLVGGLFLVAGLLGAYRGYSPAENVLLNIAGIMACLIAILPECGDCGAVTMHGFAAISFFLLIACVIIFCSRQTLMHPLAVKNLKDRIQIYRKRYRLCAGIMVLGPLAALILNWTGEFKEAVLFAEWVGVWSFASFWVIKTKELRESGLLTHRPSDVANATRD